MGRPIELTPELQKLLCDALKAGNTRKDAAHHAGISVSTLYSWMKRGRQGEVEFLEFLSAVEGAEAECAYRNVAFIQKAAAKDWRAAAWWLERRREDFSTKEKHEHEHVHTGGLTIIEEVVTSGTASDNPANPAAPGATGVPQE